MIPGHFIKKYFIFAVFLSGTILLACYHHIEGRNTLYRVDKVYDGDTIKIDDGRKIRLIGVDAPEVQSPYGNAEEYGEESKAYLKNMIEGKKVRIVPGKEITDKYGRTLAYVYSGRMLINGRIIKDGLAKTYLKADYPEKDLFINYEKQAKSKGLGIWKK